MTIKKLVKNKLGNYDWIDTDSIAPKFVKGPGVGFRVERFYEKNTKNIK